MTFLATTATAIPATATGNSYKQHQLLQATAAATTSNIVLIAELIIFTLALAGIERRTVIVIRR
jgi:glyoxylate utilization-related uncharacterized protein